MLLPAGITARPLVHADAAAVAELTATQDLLDAGEVLVGEADVRANWQRPSFDLTTSTVGAFEGDRLVGYAEVSSDDRGDAAVHPGYRGRGIGTALARWMQATARARGAAAVGMPTPAASPGAQLLADLGYQVRWTSWVLQLPRGAVVEAAPIPSGYTVRPATPDEYRDVHRVIDDAFGAWGEREPYGDFLAAAVERPGFAPWQVRVAAGPSGEVVGAACLTIDGETCYVSKLAVQDEHRNRGLARALLADAFARGGEHGAPVGRLATDSRSGALGLYEKVGMIITSTWLDYRIDL